MNFLRRSISRLAVKAITPVVRGRLGYRLGTRITTLPDEDNLKRRRSRVLANEARRLRAMQSLLPPQRGSRRAEFSSYIDGRWTSMD